MIHFCFTLPTHTYASSLMFLFRCHHRSLFDRLLAGGSLLLRAEFPLCPSIRERLAFLPCLHVTEPQIQAQHMETDVTLLKTDSQALDGGDVSS